MTIDEKLQHFYEVSLDEAREHAPQAIQAHKEQLARPLSVVKSTRLFLPNRSLSEETCPENRKN